MFVVLSHLPRLPRGDILYVLLTQKCETQLLFPIKAEGKQPKSFRPEPFFRPIVHQTRPCRDTIWGEIYVTIPTTTTAVCYEVTPNRKQTLRCSSSTQHYHCLGVSRADNTRLVHGTRLPLNYVLDLFSPSVTCRGVTVLSIVTHCTHHYSL